MGRVQAPHPYARLVLAAAVVLAACSRPSEEPSNSAPRRGLAASAAPSAVASPPGLPPPRPEEVLGTLDLTRPVRVEIETDHGAILCDIDARRTPRGAALFVGLATGRARWLNPSTRAVEQRPLYENLTIHRAIPGIMIQSGCPVGDGTGNPGYRILVEARADDLEFLGRPGALVLARYQPPPNRSDPAPPAPDQRLGSQFAITLADMRHLAGEVTVLGRCTALDVVRDIAETFRTPSPRPLLRRVRVLGPARGAAVDR